jgi:hypothetical protein
VVVVVGDLHKVTGGNMQSATAYHPPPAGVEFNTPPPPNVLLLIVYAFKNFQTLQRSA